VTTALQCLPPSAAAARRLAARLSLPLDEIALHRFPDDELRVTVAAAAATTIVFASLDQPNDKLLALLFAAEALRRGGAGRLVLAAPYLCYMRQDTAFHQGEAISQKVVGKLLAASFDRVVTVDAHLHRTKDIRDVFPGIEAENLSAMPAIADALRGSLDRKTVIVGPDAESAPWVADLAGRNSPMSRCSPAVRRCWSTTSCRRVPRSSLAPRPCTLPARPPSMP
jgi:ribose-phosphate pyrophosphokinase